MIIEQYIDENGNTTPDQSKAKLMKIISIDSETGLSIRSWTIKI